MLEKILAVISSTIPYVLFSPLLELSYIIASCNVNVGAFDVLVVFWYLEDYPSIRWHHLKIVAVLILPFNLDFFYFFLFSDCCG